jgi:protein-S-isoprenylcysteine O-methyltransferase Ste14
MLLALVVSVALFLGLAAWGWGGWQPLLAHPARVGACLVIVLAMLATLFADLGFRRLHREDFRGGWPFGPLMVLSVALAGLPAYTDRRNIVALDGDAVRYLGLALLSIGCVLRIGPMYALRHRFTWPLAHHEEHRLVTTGFYRYIRNPSYLGGLLGGIGWVLVFRSGIGLLLMLLAAALMIPIMRAEETLLASEFGDAYDQYRRRTWRLIPFLY